MRVTDHLNMTGVTPLLGPNEDALGTRFPDMSHAYDRRARRPALVSGRGGGEASRSREGVYAALLGPSYETARGGPHAAACSVRTPSA